MARSTYVFGEYRLDPSRREILHGDAIVAVSPPVFDCIAYLIQHRDRAVGRDELISAVWGRTEVKDDLLAQTLVRARRAVGDTGNEQRAIRTIPRFGYRWTAAVESVEEASPAAPAPEAVLAPEMLPPAVIAPGASSPATAAPPTSTFVRRPPRRLVTALLLLCIGIAAGVWLVASKRQHQSMPTSTTVAANGGEVYVVLPVEIAQPARETAWIRLGAMDYIATILREQGHLRVLPSEAVMRLIGAREPAQLDAAELERLRTAAGAAYILTPRATPTANGWRVALDIDRDGHRASYAAAGADPLEAATHVSSMFLSGLGVPSQADEAGATPAVEAAQRIGAAVLAADLVEARRLIGQLPDAVRAAPEVQLVVGKVALRGGHVDEAAAIFTPLAAASALTPVQRTLAHLGLGAVAVHRRDFDEAEREYTAAITALGGRDDPYLRGLVYIGLGVADGGRGRTESALTDFGRARVEMERAGNWVNIADIDVDMAEVEANRGRHAAALVLFDRAIVGLDEFGAKDHLAIALLNKTTSQLALLDLAGAAAGSERAWEIAGTLHNRTLLHRAAAIRVRALLTVGQLDAAAKVLDLVDPAGTEDPELAVLRGRLAFERGDVAAARQRATDAIERFGAPVASPGAPADATELVLFSLDALRGGGGFAPVSRLVAKLHAGPAQSAAARLDVALALAAAELQGAAGDPSTPVGYAAAFAAAERNGEPDLVVVAGVAQLRYLIAQHSLDEAMNVLGRLRAYTGRDYATARAATAVYQARGERSLAEANAAQARSLAGERDPQRPL